ATYTSFLLRIRLHLRSTLFPYTTLFRSYYEAVLDDSEFDRIEYIARMGKGTLTFICPDPYAYKEEKNLDIDEGLNTVYNGGSARSEEHTSELQSRFDLVCRLLLEKKKQH